MLRPFSCCRATFLGVLLVLCSAAWSLSQAGSSGAIETNAPAAASYEAEALPAYTRMTDGVVQERVVIRFLPYTMARVRGGSLVSLSGSDLSPVSSILSSISGGVVSPRFPQPEELLDQLRELGESRTGRLLPDLNLYAQVDLPPPASPREAESRLASLLEGLMAADGVAEAWAEPLAAPAREVWNEAEPRPTGGVEGRGFGAGGGARASDLGAHSTLDGGSPNLAGSPSQAAYRSYPTAGDSPRDSSTPDFSPLQEYLYDSPVGINAPGAWTYPGGLGQGIDFIDIEWGWLWAHEDLPEPFFTSGAYGTDDHGTAVVGEVSAPHNGYGVNGIAPGVRTGAVSLNTFSVAGGIIEAAANLEAGDVFLMEVQCGGPVGWMPCEWWQDVFDAISVATANGILCVEAGGNGSIDLDDQLYGGLFDRRNRDSNAIMVGAGTPYGLNAEGFSNYGLRVDLQGWGSSIVTTCCGDLQGGDPEVRYTSGFNGTSGASPIVTGALASLQGQALELFGEPMTPDLAEEILSATGSPWAGDRQIGERPDLLAARDRLLLGFGDLTILVREGLTLEPMEGRVIEMLETGRLDKTGPGGETTLQLSATDYTVRAQGDFFHPSVDVPCTVIQGQSQNLVIDMFPAPMGQIGGQVRGESGFGLEGAVVEILHAPLDPVTTGPDGSFLIAGVPSGTEYELIAYGLPGHGVCTATIPVAAEETAEWNPVLPEAETFEESDGGHAAGGEWEWGTPTFPYQDPVPTFSGLRVWGIDLDGPYDNLGTSWMTTPVIDATQAEQLFLSFHHWFWIDPEDGGQVQVKEVGQSQWTVVDPVGGYPDDNIQVLVWTGGYNGHTVNGYIPAIFDLSAWVGTELQIRFYFRSDYSGYKLGWYIDDLALDFGSGDPATVEGHIPGGTGPGVVPPVKILGSAPNPFRDRSVISYALAEAGAARLELYAPNGAMVRSMDLGLRPAGEHRIEWDGLGFHGRSVGTGVFFFMIRTPLGEAGGRLLRVR